MTAQAAMLREHSNSYDIFILVLTIFSLAVMVLLLLPLSPADAELLRLYDNAVCVDLPHRLLVQPRWREAQARVFHRRGGAGSTSWAPSRAWASSRPRLLRLFRLSRLARVTPTAAGPGMKQLIKDVLNNRGQYATFITILWPGSCSRSASPRPAVREPVARREHHDRRRCALVGDRDHHDGRLRRLLPGHGARAASPASSSCSPASGSSAAWPASWPACSCRRRGPEEPAPEAIAPASGSTAAPPMAPDAIVEELALLRAEIAELREALSLGQGLTPRVTARRPSATSPAGLRPRPRCVPTRPSPLEVVHRRADRAVDAVLRRPFHQAGLAHAVADRALDLGEQHVDRAARSS